MASGDRCALIGLPAFYVLWPKSLTSNGNAFPASASNVVLAGHFSASQTRS